MRSNYLERRSARIQRYKELAEKNEVRAEASFSNARKISSSIPMGQPILVGHHSEKGHRALINKIDNNMRSGVEADKKASYYEDKAKSALNNSSISADDPCALEKLKEKLKGLVDLQTKMKEVNIVCRSKKFSDEQKEVKLQEKGISAIVIHQLLNPAYSFMKKGFQSYSIQNNNANIKRIKERIEQLEKSLTEESTCKEVNGVRIFDNVEENRLQLFFPSIPEERLRKELKGNGFRWSKMEGCWQRFRSARATNLGVMIAEKF